MTRFKCRCLRIAGSARGALALSLLWALVQTFAAAAAFGVFERLVPQTRGFAGDGYYYVRTSTACVQLFDIRGQPITLLRADSGCLCLPLVVDASTVVFVETQSVGLDNRAYHPLSVWHVSLKHGGRRKVTEFSHVVGPGIVLRAAVADIGRGGSRVLYHGGTAGLLAVHAGNGTTRQVVKQFPECGLVLNQHGGFYLSGTYTHPSDVGRLLERFILFAFDPAEAVVTVTREIRLEEPAVQYVVGCELIDCSGDAIVVQLLQLRPGGSYAYSWHVYDLDTERWSKIPDLLDHLPSKGPFLNRCGWIAFRSSDESSVTLIHPLSHRRFEVPLCNVVDVVLQESSRLLLLTTSEVVRVDCQSGRVLERWETRVDTWHWQAN